MYNQPATTPRRTFDFTNSAFLIVAFLTGIAGALQTPTLSLFLTNEVHARPVMVGFFFTGSAVIGILVSQFLAGRSDRRGRSEEFDYFLLCAGGTGVPVICLEPELFYFAVCRGISEQFRFYCQPANVRTRPRTC